MEVSADDDMGTIIVTSLRLLLTSIILYSWKELEIGIIRYLITLLFLHISLSLTFSPLYPSSTLFGA
jgi:hypothetical protein